MLVRHAKVPVWLPWPLPSGWLVSGFIGAGDERTGTRGSAVALSGPNPLGGPAEMLIIAEEPGVGLGAGLAGLPGPDPGDGFAASQPHATVKVANHEAPLWLVESDGKAIFVGEVSASWVWLVLWPDTAGTLLVEPAQCRLGGLLDVGLLRGNDFELGRERGEAGHQARAGFRLRPPDPVVEVAEVPASGRAGVPAGVPLPIDGSVAVAAALVRETGAPIGLRFGRADHRDD